MAGFNRNCSHKIWRNRKIENTPLLRLFRCDLGAEQGGGVVPGAKATTNLSKPKLNPCPCALRNATFGSNI